MDFFGQNIPSYDLFLIVLGPVVLGVLWLLFQRTRWGVLVRAATQDRDMVAALGVNQKWLFTSVFAVGVFLAALGGALQIPRDAVHHAMDLRIIVDVFVVVVIGGLGSIIGAFVAAVLVSELNAFGILIFPKISIILVFLVMAVVLIVRPWGLFGRPEAPARRTPGLTVNPWRPLTPTERLAALAVLALAAMLPFVGGNYALTVGAEVLIFVIFAASLHFLMSVGGLASFGHAAYFGLGAYGVALLAKMAGLPMIACLLVGPLLGLPGRGGVRLLCRATVRRLFRDADPGLRADRVVDRVPVGRGDRRRQRHSRASGRSHGPASPSHFYWLSLGVAALAVAALRIIVFSPFGFALRAIARLAAAQRSHRHQRQAHAVDRVRDRGHASPASRARCSPISRAAYFPTISASRCRSMRWSWCCSAASRRCRARWSAPWSTRRSTSGW